MKVLLIIILVAVLVVILFIFTRSPLEEGVAPGSGETGSPSVAAVRKQAELVDVSGGQASGIAQTLYENGKFTHSVVALILDSPSGKFYEGWLVRKEGGQVANFFSTGKMTKEGNAYVLNFEDTKDYPEHNDVVITLEEVDDKQPEVHILEGISSVVNQ